VISNPSQWSIDDTHLDSQRQFWRRLQISWSSSISGPEGVVFIAFVAYTNEDGQQTYGR
jgi:hypothetical protein